MQQWLGELVWCSENCYRSQTEELRKLLVAIAQKYDTELVCLKKVDRYIAWLSSPSSFQRHYTLLTDWREAKPCVQAFTEGAAAVPVAMFVYCDNALTFRRASAWARKLDPKLGRVHVIFDVSDLEPALLCMVCALRDKTNSCYTCHRRKLTKSKANQKVERVGTLTSEVTTPRIANSIGYGNIQWELNMSAPVMQSTLVHLMMRCSTQKERRFVEQSLIAAAPDHYDE
eukprot:CAMPEP_0169125758 /NCGR_PEP_ID=MMETSP1015-20121227/35068_1 /TAXON_ID=342587 /ORGANISM="Karlodinium micrum, Strain CCMP2283" /LENGTH=228 /DNA_ID=CAMNT_0009189341 /DNA_START=43 /DNA_END=729 /DNA_ORIENTATION=+